MAAQSSRRLINIIGGTRGDYHHGAFAADAFRRTCLVSQDVKLTTYSHLGSTRKTAQYSGLTRVLSDCELDQFYCGFGLSEIEDEIEEKCREFAENSIALHKFSECGKLNKFNEKELLCYIAGYGTNDGRVMCGKHGVGPWICDQLSDDQKVLMVVDACRANIWTQSVPSNVSVIGAKFTSCLSSEARLQNDDGPVGSLIQWALDSALHKHNIDGGDWTKYLLEAWDRIVWKIKAPEKDKELLLHNIEPWIHVLPSFYQQYMTITPYEAFGDETRMLHVDILSLIGASSWSQVFELMHVPIKNEDVLPKLIEDLQFKVPSLSPYFASAVIRYCLIKGIDLWKEIPY